MYKGPFEDDPLEEIDAEIDAEWDPNAEDPVTEVIEDDVQVLDPQESVEFSFNDAIQELQVALENGQWRVGSITPSWVLKIHPRHANHEGGGGGVGLSEGIFVYHCGCGQKLTAHMSQVNATNIVRPLRKR